MTMAHAAASGQSCQPYWAGLPRVDLTSASINYGLYDDGTGPAVCSARGEPVVYERWANRQWQPLPITGLPPNPMRAFGLLASFDDGTGPALYSLLRYSSTVTGAVRFRDNAWSQMSAAFWQYDGGGRWLPMTSADLGDGMHIYGKLPTGRVCRWNGFSWDQIGQDAGSDRDLSAMIGYDDGHGMALYVFGDFTSFNGVPALQFAKWDGHSWTGPWAPGVGSYSGQGVLTVADLGDGPKLYTDYTPVINGEWHYGLSRWDGATWEFLGGPDTSQPEFYGIHAFDDGSGPSLFITGLFSNFAGLPAHNMIRYDAQGFHLVPGTEPWGLMMGIGVIRDERGESLVMRGAYHSPQYYPTVAEWVGCRVHTCPADCNADGRLNVLDFMCFLNAYAAFDPYANTHADGLFDIQDFVSFMNRFSAGCP